MRLILSKQFKDEFKNIRPPWQIFVQSINTYIETLNLPEEWFEPGPQHSSIDRFRYFYKGMNGRFKKGFRRDNCHPPIFEKLIECGIQDDEVLWWYMWEFLEFKIPRVPVCSLYNSEYNSFDFPHRAPFDYVKDMFFERTRNSVAFANRTGGKTRNVAILNHLDMAFKPGCEVASAGSTLDQAGKVYRYFTGFHKHDQIKGLLSKIPTKSRTEYNNDSVLEVITGSVKGLNSPHPQKARVDEVELMDWDTLQEAFSMTKSSEGITAQLSLLSTRKYDTGTFQRLLEESEATGLDIYCWCVYEVLEKCTRECKDDSDYGDCPILDKCKGMAHNCSGFYEISDWIDKARLLNKDVLDAQWLCKKPSQEVKVYGDYWKREVHMGLPMGFEPVGSYIMVMSAIDFGSSPGHPFVYQKAWVDYSDVFKAMEELEPGKELVYKLIFYIFYEYRSASATMAAHAQAIKESPHWLLNEVIFADPSAKQSRIDLLELYKIDTYGAINAVEDGIDKVRNHLETWYDYSEGGKEKSWYYIIDGYLDSIDDLIGTDKEFELYRYPKQQDGKVVRRRPIDINDHGMDTTRYIIQSAYHVIEDFVVPQQEYVEEEGYWFKQ